MAMLGFHFKIDKRRAEQRKPATAGVSVALREALEEWPSRHVNDANPFCDQPLPSRHVNDAKPFRDQTSAKMLY